jgi:2-keto-4-pentenoate hydratase/2-oxohepta-3-ene-1,7-dioic acid hydratase in catechol pathway
MSVNVIRFIHQNRTQWGVAEKGRIRPVPGDFPTTAAFLRAHSLESLSALAPPALDEQSVSLLSPITPNQQFVCQGANYRSHMLESGVDPKDKTFNMIFTKAASCIAPADTDVIRPQHVRLLDYEVELGLVLGADVTTPRAVSASALHEVLAGIVIVNDYSARDVQIPETQFYKGKSFRTFGPVGPYLCLLAKEEFAKLGSLRLRLSVNGQVRQDALASDMVFAPAETLTELSAVQDLGVGDLIATGTPAGCALRVPPKFAQKIGALLPDRTRFGLFVKGQEKSSMYLKPGDRVEATIRSEDGAIDLGVQRNTIVAETR